MPVIIDITSRKSEITDLASHLGGFISYYTGCWWDAGSLPPRFRRSYTGGEQARNEKETTIAIKKALREIRKYPSGYAAQEAWSRQAGEAVRNACRFILELTGSYMDILLNGGFITITDTFIREAKRFMPAMNIEDIIQALRNVWIMNSIQMMLGQEVEHTPSVFAYSMLYPCTDNYLDDSGVAGKDKLAMSSRFARRLSGQPVKPMNELENDIFDLVSMIEDQYPRSLHPAVYDSLIAIHSAQEKSLMQQSKGSMPYDADILGLSIEKGGASVLADAFLTKGRLYRDEAFHMYGFGIFLQLCDDLQDVESDLKNGHMTIFSQTCVKWKLDGLVNRLINFTFNIIDSWEETAGFDQNLAEVIRNSCLFLITAAVAQNKKYFSSKYLKEFERHTPFSLNYISRLQKSMVKEYSRLKKMKNFNGSEPFATVISCMAHTSAAIL